MDDPFLKYLGDLSNAGELSGADGAGEAGDTGCGALIRFSIRFSGEHIGAARFQATGSSAAIAAGSWLSSHITSKTWREAAAVSAQAVEAALGNGAVDGREKLLTIAANFAVEALHASIEDSLRRGNFPESGVLDDSSVLVAMSGGVDSSVAGFLERESGKRVIGVTMRLWSDPACSPGRGPGCCSPAAIRDARAVCHFLGLPHLTVDYRQEFEEQVVADFVTGYMEGRTPNPCTRCNGTFRFPALAELADKLGSGRIATGHYAGIHADDHRGLLLRRGRDAAKDQSYMLWGIPRRVLSRLEFPLGQISKTETRRLAREASLPTHSRAESQEICFIPDDDYRRFLRTRIEKLPATGEIVDVDGNPLGRHNGFMDYTVGQRRGLGISAPEPLYVLSISPSENQVVAGERERLDVSSIIVEGVNYFMPLEHRRGLKVQIRYNSGAVEATAERREDGSLQIGLASPVRGVAPGQSAVIYLEDDDSVIAGGVISSAF